MNPYKWGQRGRCMEKMAAKFLRSMEGKGQNYK
jgi:hypothetical protein